MKLNTLFWPLNCFSYLFTLKEQISIKNCVLINTVHSTVFIILRPTLVSLIVSTFYRLTSLFCLKNLNISAIFFLVIPRYFVSNKMSFWYIYSFLTIIFSKMISVCLYIKYVCKWKERLGNMLAIFKYISCLHKDKHIVHF